MTLPRAKSLPLTPQPANSYRWEKCDRQRTHQQPAWQIFIPATGNSTVTIKRIAKPKG
jgi:hypothetical protein